MIGFGFEVSWDCTYKTYLRIATGSKAPSEFGSYLNLVGVYHRWVLQCLHWTQIRQHVRWLWCTLADPANYFHCIVCITSGRQGKTTCITILTNIYMWITLGYVYWRNVSKTAVMSGELVHALAWCQNGVFKSVMAPWHLSTVHPNSKDLGHKTFPNAQPCSERRRTWESVLMIQSSTPVRLLMSIRFTAFDPPPPTPITWKQEEPSLYTSDISLMRYNPGI